MIRLHFVVEGQAEETFVNEVLAKDLIARDIFPSVRCVLTTDEGSHPAKGGGNRYRPWRKDILRSLKVEKGRDVFLTTMIDFYGLPRDFPGRDECSGTGNPAGVVSCLEQRLLADLDNDPRFIPYIQLHEFEALLFTDPDVFPAKFTQATPAQIQQLREIRASCATVDEINDGKTTAPSKRIIDVFPEYQKNKPMLSALIAIDIDLDRMSAASPHFRQWLESLRNLRPLADSESDATT